MLNTITGILILVSLPLGIFFLGYAVGSHVKENDMWKYINKIYDRKK